ncbi:MAG: hypothetical protein II399_04975 [Lachnospiraceae bacterium]|nr:hypothetical protein [Lachnospiraceae bacterium]
MKYVKLDDVLKFKTKYWIKDEAVEAVPVSDIMTLITTDLPEEKKINAVVIGTSSATYKTSIRADNMTQVREHLLQDNWIEIYDMLTRRNVLINTKLIEYIKVAE